MAPEKHVAISGSEEKGNEEAEAGNAAEEDVLGLKDILIENVAPPKKTKAPKTRKKGIKDRSECKQFLVSAENGQAGRAGVL